MARGRVIRAIAGFYYVESLDGDIPPVECSIRGKLKLFSEGILVGDQVTYEMKNGQGVITEILPRTSILKRPYIANIDLIVLVFAYQNPDPSDSLIHKFLVLAATSGIPYLMVFNKTDLVSNKKGNQLIKTYQKCGYQVFSTSTVTNLGKRTLKKALTGTVSVFAGPSGVGKSALLNMIAPGLKLKTGVVSEKIGRGKHTTREVQLLKINSNSYIADTPGFSQIDLNFLKPEELAGYFPDFHSFQYNCKFNTCLHLNEPGCAVKAAVTEAKIAEVRYQSYLELLKEIKENWENRYH